MSWAWIIFATGRPANLAGLSSEPRFTLVEQDICQPFDLGPVDYLFNFASPPALPITRGSVRRR